MAIERGQLADLLFDDRTLASHRILGAVLGAVLKLPPVGRALASEQVKSRYLEALFARRVDGRGHHRGVLSRMLVASRFIELRGPALRHAESAETPRETPIEGGDGVESASWATAASTASEKSGRVRGQRASTELRA